MKKAFLLALITFLKINILSAQESLPAMLPDSVVIAGSSLTVTDSINFYKGENRSVFDIYWVTNSIKSGWKASDTAMVGYGLEPCDTAHPFIMPVTGKFWRGVSHYHSGWDIGSEKGTPVLAGLNGKVRFSGYSSGYGNLVIVRHFSGLEMYYAHLSKLLVAKDQFVDAGDTLGLAGATGRARGNHLHMEFRICDKALDISDYYVQDDTVVNLYKIRESVLMLNQPQSEEFYIVVKGDNLSGIAYRHDTTVTNLCTLNGISRNSILQIGQRLRVR